MIVKQLNQYVITINFTTFERTDVIFLLIHSCLNTQKNILRLSLTFEIFR